MSELALQLIAENKAKHERGEDATYLDLGNCGLTEVPNEIKNLVWLETLTFSGEWWEYGIENGWHTKKQSLNSGESNNLSNINGVEKLTSLKKLIITKNINNTGTWLISDLTPIKGLNKLEEIYFSYTAINDLKPLSNSHRLKLLHCYSTRIEDLSPLANLLDLRLLYISGSPIHELTPLSHLVRLEKLFCSGTKITDLSPLSKLENLQEFHCSGTKVSDLSPLSKLNQLKLLRCNSTKVKDLSPILSMIKRGHPVKWSNAIGSIRVRRCPLIHPPIEIVKQGNEAIIQYFEEIEHAKVKGETIRLTEAKCLILGEGGAGKTSLVRKLLNKNNPLPKEEETTKGIDVYPHDLKLPDNTNFRLNLWDFGGQEIYHATHQFFLTKRSLYILLDDTRKDEKTINDPTFNYWLQVAELYGGDSPLLIVQNEKGDRSKELDLKGMQGRFGFVKDSKATNLLNCRGLDDVWLAITYWLQQLPHIGEEQPKVWLDIRRELERIAKEEKRDHITLEEYYRVCSEHTIPEKKRALFLSSYLHDFGAFLHFQDHPLLRKMLVLNNQWATDGVYKVLDNETVKKAFGRFTRAHLAGIWSGDRYAEQHDELLALMEKFELCYKLPDAKEDTWLAPQLLTAIQPEALTWDDSNNLRIRYEYEFMPKGLLSQHIVRMHRYIREHDLAWKSGVVFERANSKALVKEAWGSRNISLQANGPQAKELLTLLSEDFDKMHERLEGLKVKKMIPCNCPICGKSNQPHFYEYDDLARRKAKGKETIECSISYEDVPVRKLLDEVFALNVQNPRQLLRDGYIEDALHAMPLTNEVSMLLSQIKEAERRFLHNMISREDYNLEKSKVSAAALKLMK